LRTFSLFVEPQALRRRANANQHTQIQRFDARWRAARGALVRWRGRKRFGIKIIYYGLINTLAFA
jgi:hypothetical protein